MGPNKWEPTINEDKLLQKYWQKVKGCIYTEVAIGFPGGRGSWHECSNGRRIDGVRFSNFCFDKPGIFGLGRNKKLFLDDLKQNEYG